MASHNGLSMGLLGKTRMIALPGACESWICGCREISQRKYIPWEKCIIAERNKLAFPCSKKCRRTIFTQKNLCLEIANTCTCTPGRKWRQLNGWTLRHGQRFPAANQARAPCRRIYCTEGEVFELARQVPKISTETSSIYKETKFICSLLYSWRRILCFKLGECGSYSTCRFRRGKKLVSYYQTKTGNWDGGETFHPLRGFFSLTVEAPERVKRLSTIPISRLCLMFLLYLAKPIFPLMYHRWFSALPKNWLIWRKTVTSLQEMASEWRFSELNYNFTLCYFLRKGVSFHMSNIPGSLTREVTLSFKSRMEFKIGTRSSDVVLAVTLLFKSRMEFKIGTRSSDVTLAVVPGVLTAQNQSMRNTVAAGLTCGIRLNES